MTATELADRLEKWQMICRDDMADWQAAIAELRRIPELERRAELLPSKYVCEAIRSLLAGTMVTPGGLAIDAWLDLVDPPKPLLTWQDHGNGVWTARHGGATYLVSPACGGSWWLGRCIGGVVHQAETESSIDAAKATAEKWAGGR